MPPNPASKVVVEGLYMPPPRVKSSAFVKSLDEYRALYEKSIKEPVRFLFLLTHTAGSILG